MEVKQRSLNIRQLINTHHGGKIFTVEFIKADNTLRKMVCRLDVKKHLKGGASTTDHKDNLLTVFEMGNSYRSINLDKVKKLIIGKKTFHFD